MRTGRPRAQNVDRYPCGKIKRTAEAIAAAQKAADEAEMQTVLSQPHRRGNRSQLAESPLGRFCLEHDLPREIYDAGEAYASIRRQWAAAWDAPLIDRLGGSGRDIEHDQLLKWRDLLAAWERAMRDGGGIQGCASAISLIVERSEIPIPIYPAEAKAALYSLARYQGRMR